MPEKHLSIELAVTYVPLPPSLVLVHVNDLTERREVETRLRESEDRFRAMVEMTPVPFLIARVSDGQIRYMNPILRAAIGESADELVGKSTTGFYADPTERERLLGRLSKEGSLRNVELQVLRPGGRPVWVSISANLIRYEGEDCALTTMVDLTEQKLMEEALTTLATTTGGSESLSGVERILGVFAVRAAAELVRERAQQDLSRAEAKIREYADRQQRLAHQLLGTQENERRRIAHELHDEIGQALTAVHLNLAALLRQSNEPETGRRLQESMDIVDRVLEQAHDMSLDLRPSVLDDLGLAPALRWYAGRLARRAELQLKLNVDEVGKGFDPALETACFRVAQEALTNVARHARAQTVTVSLRQDATGLELEVQDDGAGFDPAPEARRADGHSRLGLLGMEERVSLVGGHLEIQSEPGLGTHVRARFPMKQLR